MTILSAAFLTFSCGRFFVPGRRLRSERTRPSSCSSAVTIKYCSVTPSALKDESRNRTTSTTRTKALCLAASIMICEAPVSSSTAKRSMVLAVPWPKSEVSMPWFSSICPTSIAPELRSTSSMSPPLPVRATLMPSASAIQPWRSARGHHSKVRILSANLSMTRKDGLLSKATGVALALSMELSSERLLVRPTRLPLLPWLPCFPKFFCK
mmetsp:Transcript_60795/g.199080  ORF Transcript_60795/g.199080 Transcript_60795/m.199080 type:complete len:210 (+) Transcript_60795:1027-1656(+)